MNEQIRFYRGIRVVSKQSSQLERERGHQQLNPKRLTGRLTFDILALQRLHIGDGMLLPPERLGLNTDIALVKVFFRADDTLAIPGSSLKGGIRSLVELFTHSCISKTTVRWRGDDRDDYGECRYNSKRHHGSLCPACKIFGAMGYQGQVRFADALQVAGDHECHNIPPQYGPNPDRNRRRYYPYDLTDDREPTWPLEVATIGSRFAGYAEFTNLSQGELGLLLIALGQGEWSLCPRLGAGKSSGLGGVCIENLIVEEWQTDQAYRGFSSDVWQPVDIEACLKAARPLVRIDALAQLAGDLKRV